MIFCRRATVIFSLRRKIRWISGNFIEELSGEELFYAMLNFLAQDFRKNFIDKLSDGEFSALMKK
jgi:hypothetical protein